MDKLCLLITKNLHSHDDVVRVLGPAKRARERGADVTVYLLGDGVLGAKSGLKDAHMKEMVDLGGKVRASAKDLKARAVKETEPGVELLEEFEKEFITDMMENSDRVISW